VLKECFNSVTRVSQECFKRFLRVSQEGHKSVAGVLPIVGASQASAGVLAVTSLVSDPTTQESGQRQERQEGSQMAAVRSPCHAIVELNRATL
jgi:hypothetical protein